MSTPATTIIAATVAGTAVTSLITARDISRLRTDGDGLARDVLLGFGLLVVGGALLGGVTSPNSIGRGLLWGAGGLAAAYGIDKALVKR